MRENDFFFLLPAGEYFPLGILHQHLNDLFLCLVRTLGGLPK